MKSPTEKFDSLLIQRPFRSKTNDGLTYSILNDQLDFEDGKEVKSELKDLMVQFIERDITKRLGCVNAGGFDRLKQHSFFAEMDWDLVASKKFTPPFIPDVNIYLT
jgi:serine/threonine kinase 32